MDTITYSIRNGVVITNVVIDPHTKRYTVYYTIANSEPSANPDPERYADDELVANPDDGPGDATLDGYADIY